MNSELSKLCELDDINVNCNVHNIPISGVCGEVLCGESKFLCIKCALSAESCITAKSHELISLSELLHRFFTRKETGNINFNRIKSLMEGVSKINKNEISNKLTNFVHNTKDNLDNKFNKVLKMLNDYMKNFKESVSKQFNSIVDDLQKCKNVEQNDFLLPKAYKIDDIKQFIEENEQNIISFLGFMKSYFTLNELKDKTKEFELMIYSKKVVDFDPDNTFTQKLTEIETQVKTFMGELKELLIPDRDKNVFVFSEVKYFLSDPSKLSYIEDITNQSQKAYCIDNSFCSFISVKGEHLVMFSTSQFKIELYDLSTKKIMKTITGHTGQVFILRHFLHKLENTDLILSSSYDKSVKVYSSAKDYNCILTISSCHTSYYIYSAMIFNDILFEKKLVILTSVPNEKIKVWDMTGKLIKEIGSTSDYTYYINMWHDQKNNKYYLINGNSIDIKMYDYKTNELYKNFKGDPQVWHMTADIVMWNGIPHLVEADGYGALRVWNIYEGKIVKQYSKSGINIRGIILWNEQYAFAGSSDKTILLIDIKNGTLIKSLTGHENCLCSLEKIVHPTLGEVLISAAIDGKIKVWGLK